MLKQEISKLVREYNLLAHPQMVCSIAKVMQMKYKNINTHQVCKLAKEILF